MICFYYYTSYFTALSLGKYIIIFTNRNIKHTQLLLSADYLNQNSEVSLEGGKSAHPSPVLSFLFYGRFVYYVLCFLSP